MPPLRRFSSTLLGNVSKGVQMKKSAFLGGGGLFGLGLPRSPAEISHCASLLYFTCWNQAKKPAFYQFCGPVADTFRSNFELLCYHSWMVRSHLLDRDDKHQVGPAIVAEFTKQMEEDVSMRILPSLGVSRHSSDAIIEELLCIFEDKQAMLTRAYQEFSESMLQGENPPRMDLFYEIVWEGLYGKNEKMDIKSVHNSALYLVLAFKELDDLSLRRLCSGRLRWTTSISSVY